MSRSRVWFRHAHEVMEPVSIMRRPAPRVLAAVLGLVGASPEAGALWEDRLELFIAQSVTSDDNVFRLSEGSDPRPLLGSDSTSDRYLTTSFGIGFDVPVSAQRFVGNFRGDAYRFGQFTELDYDGHEHQAFWLWKVGEHADGRLGHSEELVLTSLANLQSGIQSGTPNFLTAGETIFDATYNAAPRWRVRGGATKLRHTNSAPEYQISDVSIAGTKIAAAFVTTSGNEIGLGFQFDDGFLPNTQVINTPLLASVRVDNSYEQRRVAALFDQNMTERSRLSLQAGRVARSYRQLPQRNFEDWMLNGVYEWRPTDKFSLMAIVRRDISSDEQVNVGFVFVEGLALQPALRLTEKTSLTVYIERSDRDYLGDAALALATPAAPAVFSERVLVTRLEVSYAPSPPLRLGLVLRRDARNATAAYADYDAEIASFEVQFRF